MRGDGLQQGQVHSRAECFAGAGEDHDARVRFLDGVEGRLEIGDHLGVDGVALVGTVEGNRGDVFAGFDKERFVSHAQTPGNSSIVGQFFEKCKRGREGSNTERSEVEHPSTSLRAGRAHREGHSEESLCNKPRNACRLEAGATFIWPLLGVHVFGADVVCQG